MLLLFLLSFSGIGFGKEVQPSIFDLMQHKEVLDVTLEADFNFLKNNRRDENSHPARLTFKDEKGEKQVWDIKVNIRGAFRRMFCPEMPPLKLNFKKSELRDAGLTAFDDLKLVPYCIENEEVAKDVLLREYLSYKLFNAIADESFRVQLLRITYKDTGSGERELQWAFLIEDAAQLRDRLGMEKVDETKAFNLPADRFDREYLKKVAVFQYMIGNTDWSLNTGKNLKYLEKNGKIVAVPYDFDFTALVNAPYFTYDSGYGLLGRQDRAFLGFPEDLADLHTAIYSIYGKRMVLEDIIKNFSLLSWASRKDLLDYLDSYFDNPEILKAGERIYLTETPEAAEAP